MRMRYRDGVGLPSVGKCRPMTWYSWRRPNCGHVSYLRSPFSLRPVLERPSWGDNRVVRQRQYSVERGSSMLSLLWRFAAMSRGHCHKRLSSRPCAKLLVPSLSCHCSFPKLSKQTAMARYLFAISCTVVFAPVAVDPSVSQLSTFSDRPFACSS